jgi:outer membrane protein assembly factor BamB
MNKQIIGPIVLMLVMAIVLFPVQAHRTPGSDTGISADDVEWWPMFHHDLQLSGYTPADSPETYNLLWESTIDKDIWFSSPAVVDEKLVIGTGHRYDQKSGDQTENPKVYDTGLFMKETTFSEITRHMGAPGSQEIGKIYCLNADTGGILWQVETNGSVFSSPAIEDGRVYFVSADSANFTGELYCLNMETGSEVWSLPVMSGFASPILSNGRMYLLTVNPENYYGRVQCLDAADGSELWNYTTGYIDFSMYTAPSLADGNIFFTSVDVTSGIYCKISCLNQSTGQLKWATKLSEMNFGYALSSPVIDDDKAYVISAETEETEDFWCMLTCVDTSNGSILWNYTMKENTREEMSFACPAVAYGNVYFTALEYEYSYGKLYCLNGENGSVQWVRKTNDMFTGSSPIISNGKVFVGGVDITTFEGNLYCVDAHTGSLIYSALVENFFMDSAPAIADDTVYIGASTGKICAFKDPCKVGEIHGGLLSVSLDIKNNVHSDVENIGYTLSVTGGLFHMINKHINGTIPVLEAQTTDTIKLIPIIGFGKIQVNATITMEDLNPIKRHAEGIILGIFVLIR